jgi:hypothetical protein
MKAIRAEHSEIYEGTNHVALARIQTEDGILLTTSLVDSITVTVYDMSLRDAPQTNVYEATPAEGDGAGTGAIWNTLQTDDGWGLDDIGYNFIHVVTNTNVTWRAGHTYRVVYQVAFTNTDALYPANVVIVPFQVSVLSALTD